MRLFVFGCSNSALYHNQTFTYREYRDYRNGTFPLTWSEILSQKLNFGLENHSIPGCGNDSIMMQLVKHLKEIKKGDIVIIGWTFIERFMWIDRIKNDWDHYQHMYSEKMDISEKTHNEILIHRSHNPSNYLYIKHIYEWVDLIDYFSKIIGFNVFYWECDGRIFLPYYMTLGNTEICLNKDKLTYSERYLLKESDGTIFDYVHNNGGQRIFEETKNLVNDHHFGESGHVVVADKFYNHIKQYIKYL